MADCLYQYTFECHSCSQQRGKEDTASSQSRREAQQEEMSVAKVFSIGENNIPRNKHHPLLYCISWKVVHCDEDRIINIGTVPLAVQFVFDARVPYFFTYKISPDTTESNCDCFITCRYWKQKSLLCVPSLPSL